MIKTSHFKSLRQVQALLKLGRWLAFALPLMTLFLCSVPSSAQASIHNYPEADQQVMYRSRLSLRDDQDQAWQTILFKRIKAGQVTDFQLRLISFPGQAELPHPNALQIQQGRDLTWELADQTLLDDQLKSVVTSLGQYDAKPFIASLDRTTALTMTVTLAEQEQRQLLVPPYVLREWLKLKDMS